VVWSANGTETFLATTFVSINQLIALVPAALLKNVGTAQVIVETGDPMADIPLAKSNSLIFKIANPPPGQLSISSLSPTSVVAGSPDLTVTIQGSNFQSIPGDIRMAVDWTAAGASSTATNVVVVSSTKLTAVIPAALMAESVTAEISVSKWHKADDTPLAVSNSLGFTVTSGNAGSSTISPPSATIGPNGSQQFTATVQGSGTFNWSIEEGEMGGSISDTGLYKPSTLGTFHVIASSISHPSENATATVFVVASGFQDAGNMEVARSGHTATLLKDGRVLIIGGGDPRPEIFDPSTGKFTLTSSPATQRLGLASATLLSDGRVLIAGGLSPETDATGHLTLLDSTEVFDPATNAFSSTGSMVQARREHTATLLNDGRVLIAGGYFDHICITASAELFDPTTGGFSAVGLMNSGRVFHTATLLNSGEVLIAGGSNGCAPDSSDDPPWDPLFVELYEPGPANFLTGGDMSTTRIGHAAIRLTDEKVVMLGGIPAVQNLDEQPQNPRYAEVYDPATGTFSPVDGLTISQKRYTATLLSSGKILVAGGIDKQEHPIPDADLVDPVSGVLTATGGLIRQRFGHTATLLNDGRVLVTGGTDVNGNALASAEIYK
jgi:hypothetical protein